MSQKPVIFLAFANDRVDDAAYLRNLPKELDGIRNSLSKAVKAGLCEVVERSNATIQNILDVFQDEYYKNRIAIFHYGGHANGYQLLLETADGGHASAHSEGLVSFLAKQKGLKLIFLNGCSSQQQALDLVDAGIPAVIGTSQSINDDVAMNLSIRFYKGMAAGHALEKSWLESIDAVKIQKGTANMRDFFFEGMEEIMPDEAEASGIVAAATPDRFPWEIYFKDGAELIRGWNLPEAVDNPLFGLPDLPKLDLPEQPYRFLERYNREHAEIFFGRSYFIRELFNRATDKNSAPIILFYGQSGVGKSSMLDAGLFPRLEQVCHVVYIRRDAEKGLLGSIFSGLGEELESYHTSKQQADIERVSSQIRQLEDMQSGADDELIEHYEELIAKLNVKKEMLSEGQNFIETQEGKSLKQIWFEQEESSQKPMIILLDQVEEIYTKPNPDIPNEIELAMAEVHSIFGNPLDRPQGKLILSYRKEYNPEIEEAFKKLQLPREKVFLQKLERRDIEEIIKGLTSTDRLQRAYELSVEQDLPVIIADDLLEDKDSPIAPVLQILLTKMWKLSEHEELRYFSVKKYQNLRRQGILMDDFFREQMDKLAQQYPELIQTGLALDILYFHTTKLGTANSHSLEDLRQRYGERQELIDRLVVDFKDLYLLSDAGVKTTGLAHDTLAPIVQEEFRLSDKPGQRAALILQNKAIAYEQDPNTVLDLDDLRLVEEGKDGMRIWVQQEEELVEKSRKRRAKVLAERKRNRRFAIVAIALICFTTVFAAYKWYAAGIAEDNALNAQKEAEKSEKIAVKEKENAVKAQIDADQQRANAERQANLANLAKGKAERALSEAERQRSIALEQTKFAEDAKDEAFKARDEADKQKEIALRQTAIATEQTKIATERELKSRRVVFGEKAKKVARNNPMKALRFAQLAYSLDPDNVPASVQETMMQISLEADLDETYSVSSGIPRKPFYTELPTSQRLYGRFMMSKDGKFGHGMGEDSTMIIWNLETSQTHAKIPHSGIYQNSIFSPDSKYLVSVTQDSTCLIWNVSENRVVTTLKTNYSIYDVDFSPTSETILLGGSDSTVRVIDLKGTVIQSIKIDHIVFGIQFSSDGKKVLVHHGHNYTAEQTWIEYWDLESEELEFETYSPKELKHVGLSKSDRFIFARGLENVVYVWDMVVGNVYETRGHTDQVMWLDMSKDGKYLVTGSKDGDAKVWLINPQSRDSKAKLVANLPHNNWVQQVHFIEGDQKILTACSDFTAKVWDLQGHLLADLKGHEGDVFSAYMSPDGSRIYTDSYDGTRKTWWMDNFFSRQIKRHKSYVNDYDYSDDGKTFITASSDKTAIVWDNKGRRLRTLKGHTSYLYGCDISPNGDYAVTASNDNTAIVWLIKEGEKTQLYNKFKHPSFLNEASFSPNSLYIGTALGSGDAYIWHINDPDSPVILSGGHTKQLKEVIFSPNNDYILTYGKDSIVNLWKMDGTRLWQNDPIRHGDEILKAKFSPDGKKVISSSKDFNVQIWEITEKGKGKNRLGPFDPHGNWVNDINFNENGDQFVTCGAFEAKRWYTKNGKLATTYSGHTNWVSLTGFLPDKSVYTYSYDSTIRFWSLNGKEIQKIKLNEVPLNVKFSDNGNKMLTSSNKGVIQVWQKQKGKFPNKPSFTLRGHDGNITTMEHSGNWMITGGADGHVVFWDTEADTVVVSKESIQHPINSLAIASDQSFVVASGNEYYQAEKYNMNGEKMATFSGHVNTINHVSLSKDNSTLFTASADHYSGLWDVATGNSKKYPYTHSNVVNTINPSVDGKYFVTASSDGFVGLWNSDGELILKIGDGKYIYTDARFSPDGTTIMGVSNDHVHLWDINGSQIADIQGHKKPVVTARFSTDSKKIITASTDGTAKLWDTTGKELMTLSGHTNYLNGAEFSDDGEYAVTFSDDNTARLWLVNQDRPELLAVLKGHTGDIVKAYYVDETKSILTASSDGTARVWTSPAKIYDWLTGWLMSGVSDREILDFGFSQKELDSFKASGWIYEEAE